MISFALALLVAFAADPAAPAAPDTSFSESLPFRPTPVDSAWAEEPYATDPRDDGWYEHHDPRAGMWLRAPFQEELLTDPEQWTQSGYRSGHTDALFDYNRVDDLRAGFRVQAQAPATLYPRMGLRLEYTFARKDVLYGVMVDQPLIPGQWVSVGGSLYRLTDHPELQQVSDLENSLAVLLARKDLRDYHEREGMEGFLILRMRPVTQLSAHARHDDYRSLPLVIGTNSIFHRGRTLRDNPPVEEGDMRSALVRAERRALLTDRARAGLYHWAELEWAGDAMGGDFTFTRAIADVRSYVRLSPGQMMSVRLAAGTTPRGPLPIQKQFTVGGVDGLRAHSFAYYRGEQMMLGGAEYSVQLWEESVVGLNALHALMFADWGKAWTTADQDYDLESQHLAVDGGFGVATSDDHLRVYFAKDLQEPSSDFVISMRLQRTF
jgi:hypothetical protein